MKTVIIFITILLSINNIAYTQEITVIDSMINAIDNINTLSCTMESEERIDKKTIVVKQKFEASFNPLKCHVKFISPNKGSKVIYDENKNNGDLHYEPSGFPYFDLNLDPFGSLARRNNHHTINEIGFVYLVDIIKYELKKKSASFETKKVKINNQIQYVIHAVYNDFKSISYKMKKGETIRDIALEKYISEYQIIKLNTKLSSFDDWTEDEITIPNHYCKEIKIYVDPENWLPLNVKIFDEHGLFEQYKYSDLKVNPIIPSTKFEIN